jgi:hypothetical protein
MTTRLGLYNGALRLCGERKLASLTENREPRRLLDDIWDDGLIDYCLEQGLWNFAMRTVKIDYSPSVEPPFGYIRAFDKPSDFIRLAGIASDEYFSHPLTRYEDEAGFWFADLDVLYLRYVSNDDAYGNDLSLWPQTFTKWVEAYMASELAPRLNNDVDSDKLNKTAKQRLTDARSKDAMNEPARFPPAGAWVGSRGSRLGRRDRARGNLIG